jgi:hypothetical protein
MLRTVVDGIGVSDGLAVDWTSDYIYYTDSTYDVIAVVHVSGTPKKIVIETMLDDPRSIAVDPNNAMIYWTSWGGSPKIERAYMSGKARTTLIGQDLSRPNAVVLDFDSRKLFWGDWGLDTIEYCFSDGTGRTVLLANAGVKYPFGLAIHNFSLYFTHVYKDHNTLKTVSTSGGQASVAHIQVFPRVRDRRGGLVMYNNTRNKGSFCIQWGPRNLLNINFDCKESFVLYLSTFVLYLLHP